MAETGWSRHLAPLDIPTVFIADDPQLIETAGAAYVEWWSDAPAGEPMIEIDLVRGSASTTPVSPTITVEGSRLTLAGGGITGWADAVTRRAHCIVPPWLIGDPAALAAEAIDALLLFILTRNGRTPIHASGVMIGETLAMLAGASGSGKSTLALAAARHGLTVLSDDTLYVQRDPRLRVWGLPRPIHVFAAEAPVGDHPVRLRGGKLKSALPVEMPDRLAADRAALVLLDRGERLVLDRVEPGAALAAFDQLDSGFDLLREDMAAAVGAVAAEGAWRLTLTDDPAAAIALLTGVLG